MYYILQLYNLGFIFFSFFYRTFPILISDRWLNYIISKSRFFFLSFGFHISIFLSLFIFFNMLTLTFNILLIGDAVDSSTFLFLSNTQLNLFSFMPAIIGLIFFYDILGVLLMLLSSFLVVICLLISMNTIKYRILEYFFLLFFLNFLLLYFFSVCDLFCFFVLYELVLVPMFLLISVWGSHLRKIHAGYQFFFYTYCGSLPLFLGVNWLLSTFGIGDFFLLSDILLWFDFFILDFSSNLFIFLKILWLGFFIGFAVKVPIYPFHIWLPEAHVEASTAGSVILAGILLKMGVFGLYRTIWSFLPNITLYFEPLLIAISFIGIIYTTIITIRQVDLKKIIAYSSVGHMSFSIIGLALFSNEGFCGAFFVLFSHGFISSFLFILIGFLYERYFTRNINYFGGLVYFMPTFVFFFFLATLANMSFPSTSSFVGELLILISFFEVHSLLTLLLSCSVIFSGIYSIWLFNRICFGLPNFSHLNKYSFCDLSKFEIILSLYFIFFIFLFGIKPSFILFLLDSSSFLHSNLNLYLVLNNFFYV